MWEAICRERVELISARKETFGCFVVNFFAVVRQWESGGRKWSKVIFVLNCVLGICTMLVSGSPLKVRSPRIIPAEASPYGQDAWSTSGGSSYKPLTQNAESDTSQLSVIFDEIIDGQSDPIVPQLRNSTKPPKTKCPWKIPWVAITNCCVQVTMTATLQHILNRNCFSARIVSIMIWGFDFVAFSNPIRGKL